MIDFTPTEEQNMLVEAVHRYAETDVRKIAHDADEEGAISEAVIRKGWDLGLLPGLIPEEYGGYSDGQDAVTGVLALEELAWGDLAVALELWTPALFAIPVLLSGSDEKKARYLPLFCDVDRPIMTAALIEPSIKFDPWRPATTAARGNGSFTLSGEKAYVPLAADAENILVYASDTETGRVDGYIVPRDAEGLAVGERELLMGLRRHPRPQPARAGRAGDGCVARLARVRARLRQGTRPVRRAHREQAGRRVPHRPHGDRGGRDARARLGGGLAGRPGAGHHTGRDAGQVLRGQGVGVRDGRRRADAGRLWLHPRVPGRALAAQRARLRDV